MDKREVVIKAIEFRGPEEVPFWHWITQNTRDKYGQELADFLKDYPPYIIELGYTVPEGWGSGREGQDEWGCIFTSLHEQRAIGGQYTGHPLSSWDLLKEYSFPDPYAEGRFDKAAEVLEKRPDAYIFGTIGNTLFERMHFLRGFENLLCDFHLHREEVNILADELLEFDLGILEGWKKLGVDGIFTLDDFGMQDRLIMSPAIWREILKPRYEKLFQAVHEANMHTIHHTCGNVVEIIPDLIEIGLDVLQSIQPHAMNIEELGKDFRGRICFMGGIDTQWTLPRGSPEQVEEEVRRCIEVLGMPDGGYIGSPPTEILPDTPLDNIKAMYEAFREYRYFR